MRKILLGLLATAAFAAPIALASSADAAVTVDNGVGHVDKGDVQTALKWNNSDFDKSTVAFTAGYTATYDNVLTCGANADNKVVHVLATSTNTGVLKATPVLSSNGKQITGWNLSGLDGAATGSNDLMAVMQATFTACLPDKPYSEMTPEELRRLPVKVVTPATPTVTFDGLKVNGVALPNTPVVVA